MSRKEGGRGITIIEDSVDVSIQRLENYIERLEGGLITTIKNKTDNMMDKRMEINRKQKCEEKELYGRFKRLIKTSHRRKPGRGKEKETLSEKQNLSE